MGGGFAHGMGGGSGMAGVVATAKSARTISACDN